MKQRKSFKSIFEIVKNTFRSFGEDNVTKLSGSLAYSTIFSMGPLLMVIIAISGFFLGQQDAEGKISAGLVSYLGEDSARQIMEIIKKAAIDDKNSMAIIVGSLILFFGATTIFAEIQDSINHIWGIKPKPKKNWLKLIRNRFLSFSVVVGLGFLLLVSLAFTALIEGLIGILQDRYPDIAVVVFYVLNLVITFVIVTTIFGIIFKVLPDARIKWKEVVTGSVVTAILFMLGKFAISFYITQSKMGNTFGAAGAVIVLLVWVYFSSLILYLGAEFTKSYILFFGSEIKPNQYAETTKKVEVETGNKPVQETEKVKSP